MQHANQAKPFLPEIQGLKPIDFDSQPEDMEDDIDRIELSATYEPPPASVDVWEHAYGVEPDGYTATCDLWRWSADDEPHPELAGQEVDCFADLP